MGDRRLQLQREGLTIPQVSLIALIVVAATTFVQTRMTISGKEHQVQQKAAVSQQYSEQRNLLASDVKTLRSQVEYCKKHPKTSYCTKPAAPDPSVRIQQVPGPQGAQGPQGVPGRAPTQQEVAAAVATYLASHPVQNGRPPTNEEVAAAVAAYLVKNPPQPGPAGQDGKDGSDGAQGPQGDKGEKGDAGPPASDDQIATAVAAYFSAHQFTCTQTDVNTWTCQVKS